MAQDNKKLSETIREIFNSTVGPMVCRGQNEFQELGFSYVPSPYAIGYYTKFYRAHKSQEQLILKTLDLSQMKPPYKRTLEESCKILEYVAKKETVPNVVRVFGQFLIGDTLFVFMRNYSERSVHYKMRVVHRFKQPLVQRWSRQLASVCKYLQEKAIVHRGMRLEHIMIDDQENIQLSGWTRAVFVLSPVTSQVNMCDQEYRCRKRNHMPPECFIGLKHNPARIDHWSFGVLMVALSTHRYPFKPKFVGEFEQQWKEFLLKHASLLDDSLKPTLTRLFVMQESARPNLDELLKINFLVESKEAIPSSSMAIGSQSQAKTPSSSKETKPSVPHSAGVITKKTSSRRQTNKPKFEAIPLTTKPYSARSNKSKKMTAIKATSPNVKSSALTTVSSVSGSSKSTEKSEIKKSTFPSVQNQSGSKPKQSTQDSSKIPNETVTTAIQDSSSTPAQTGGTVPKSGPAAGNSSIPSQSTQQSSVTPSATPKPPPPSSDINTFNVTKPSNESKSSGK